MLNVKFMCAYLKFKHVGEVYYMFMRMWPENLILWLLSHKWLIVPSTCVYFTRLRQCITVFRGTKKVLFGGSYLIK